jgi:hypothetical protein
LFTFIIKRIGRSYYDSKRQGLIPSPRVGRSSYKGFASDCSLNPESCNNNYLENWTNIPHDLHETVHEIRVPLSLAGWMNDHIYQRQARQLIPVPRFGRSGSTALKNQLISGLSSSNSDDMLDPIDLQLRAAFIPRLGKRTNNKLNANIDQKLWEDINEELKRTVALIPRVGRAAFVPRIGKKAAFVPRIGRSVENVD